jgi:2,4-dienoyl-CoA reductase-like NADH-dependent reductase (Old Yellow Enzyme family)
VGGAGLVICEATGVSPQGRITPGCTGLWNAEQMRAALRDQQIPEAEREKWEKKLYLR